MSIPVRVKITQRQIKVRPSSENLIKLTSGPISNPINTEFRHSRIKFLITPEDRASRTTSKQRMMMQEHDPEWNLRWLTAQEARARGLKRIIRGQ